MLFELKTLEDLIFSLGYYLLCLQVVSYKVLLQFLVGIINTELLQVVFREGFKAINIQQTWKDREF